MLSTMDTTKTTALDCEAMRARRVKLGYSEPELARLAGMDPAAIWRIERGLRSPRVETLRRIEKALKLRKGSLLL